MTESSEDYELFHYGVKGMRWGVRRDPDSPGLIGNRRNSQTKLTRSSATNRAQANYKLAKKNTNSAYDQVSSARGRQDRNAKKAAAREASAAESSARKAYSKELKLDRQVNRQAMKANKSVSPKMGLGKAAVATIIAGPTSAYGYNQARKYGASRGAAAATTFFAGPAAGVAYREIAIRRNTR